MIIIGLTGSIGMGKTTTAAMFHELGLPVFDADAVVHALYQPGGGGVGPVGAAFPGVIRAGGVDRAALAAHLVAHPVDMKILESIVHPLVAAARSEFLAAAQAGGAAAVVLDIPLLMETGGEKHVDVIVLASAPAEIQRERVLARPGMTEAKLQTILARQTPDSEKRRRANFVVETGEGLESARKQAAAILKALKIETKQSIVNE